MSSSQFLGVEWNTWKIVGWLGNLAFFLRFVLQWSASERQKRVVIPVAFWWLSLAGSVLLLNYALFYRRDSVFIFAYAFTWIPYVRNLILHHRRAQPTQCHHCNIIHPEPTNYCSHCGQELRPLRPA